MFRRLSGRFEWYTWVGSISLTTVATLLYLESRRRTFADFDPVTPAMAVVMPGIGALIASRRPGNVFARTFAAGGLLAAGLFAEQYAYSSTVHHWLPGGVWMAWLGTWLWIPGFLPFRTLALLLFPDGLLPSPRWRPLLWSGMALIVATTLAVALRPGPLPGLTTNNPLALSVIPETFGSIATWCVFVLSPLCLLGLLFRYHQADGRQRAQLRWFAAAGCLAVMVPVVALPLGVQQPGLYQVIGLAVMVALPGAVVVAIVRYGLYDFGVSAVTLLVNRLLVGIGLVGLLGATAWVAVGWMGAHPLLAGVCVAFAFQPLRWSLKKGIFRLRAASRANATLVHLGHRLESTVAPEEVLPAIVDAVRRALELSYVAVEVVDEEGEVVDVEVRGEIAGTVEVLPLVSSNAVVGRLSWARRTGDDPLDPADRRLLEDIVGQLAVAVYALMQTAELKRAKERLVTDRETERARWRDAHHDRLKPALGGIVCQLEAIRNTCSASGAQPLDVLRDVSGQLARLKADVWEVKEDIDLLGTDRGPKSLDELGLVGAVRHHAAKLGLPPSTLAIDVEARDDLTGLPTNVEVAAFLVISEALENVRKHSGARHCEIVLSVREGELSVEVSDDGCGLPRHLSPGLGVSSMRKRSLDLHGEFFLASLPDRGTQLLATFPLECPDT